MVPVLFKTLLYRFFGPHLYLYFQYLGKVRDLKRKIAWEKELYVLPLLVRPGESCLDIGANYAFYCYHLSRAVGITGEVHAFEPIPFTFEVCKKLVRRFDMNNVRIYNKACGNYNGKAELEIPLQSFGAISSGQAHLAGRNNELEGTETHHRFQRTMKVECDIIRVDDFLPSLKNVSLVKLDIEGAEYFAIQGAQKLIERHHPIILCEINRLFLKGFDIDLNRFLTFMEELGYRLYSYSHHDGNHQFKETSAEEVRDNDYFFIHPNSWDRVARLINRTGENVVR